MTQKLRWRKVTDINRDFALIELLQYDVPILDIGYSNSGKFELAFNLMIANQIIPYEEFMTCLVEGRNMADLDRQAT